MTALPPRPTIGLLAGMGVRSTAPFLDLVIEACQRQYGARHEPDYPPMMIYSLPVPFYPDRPVDGVAFRDTVVEGLKRLQGTGVDFIAIPCNSAHVFFDALEDAASVPLLDMTVEARRAVPREARRVALLATRYVRDSEVYRPAFVEAGRELVADDDTQAALDDLLVRLRAETDMAPLRARWREILEGVREGGADAALIACTDLNAVSGPGDDEVLPVVDGTRALAGAVVSLWRSRLGSPAA